jgi:SAM-dependent methyltransferase
MPAKATVDHRIVRWQGHTRATYENLSGAQGVRTVYFIVGPTCSGKTTTARELGKLTGLPWFQADKIYARLKQELGCQGPPHELLRRWGVPRRESQTNLQDLPEQEVQALKANALRAILNGVEGDFIFEGFTLAFTQERRLLYQIIGEHRRVILRLDIPFELWKEHYQKKMKKDGTDKKAAYERLRSQLQVSEEDSVYTFTHPKDILVKYQLYQKDDFINRKIEALKIPIISGDVVNDVGCNEGKIGRWCLDHGAALVHGYDKNWRFLDRAAMAGLRVHLSNVESDPIEQADVTLCVSVFHYFRNPRAFLDKARRATRRLFILEAPIYRSPKLLAEYFPKTGIMRYSQPLLEKWLSDHFKRVECVGESVPPDKSYRLVFHCHK